VVLSVSEVFHIAILTLLVISAFFAIWFRDLLSSVIALGVFSLVLSVEFYLLHAPDVAIAEAAIGAGLNTAIYIVALRGCGKARSKTGGDIR
jgi:energy-converting hydrogenase B subunit D